MIEAGSEGSYSGVRGSLAMACDWKGTHSPPRMPSSTMFARYWSVTSSMLAPVLRRNPDQDAFGSVR